MPETQKIFLLILDKRDSEKFRLFKLGNLQQNMGKPIHVWGVPLDSLFEWGKIAAGDIICFGDEDSGFVRYGNLARKVKSALIVHRLWPNDPRSNFSNNMLFFSELRTLRVGFHEALRRAGFTTRRYFPGLYEIDKMYISEFIKLLKLDGRSATTKKISLPLDNETYPEREREQILRLIRDTLKSRSLKKLYNDKCQICGYRIEISKEVYYSEVHHIFPLSRGGSDTFNNMIVLCPTHHAEFDFRVIAIAEDGQFIINKNSQTIGKLTLIESHKLKEKNILFQLYGCL